MSSDFSMTSDAVLIEANMMFSAGEFSEAVSKYGEYIQQQHTRLALGYSSRVAAWLQLKNYIGALNDTERVLELFPHNAKTLLQKAQAYDGLGFFREAICMYHALLQVDGLASTSVTWIRESLRKVEMKDKESNGVFEGDLLVPVREGLPNPDVEVEDFVGPVELGRTPTMGRGLFATRDVEEGDLLLVCNPLLPITIHGGGEGGYEEAKSRGVAMLKDGMEKIRKESLDNLQDFRRLQQLIQMDMLVGHFPHDPVRDLPSMRYFTPVNALAPADKVVSLSDLNHPCIHAELHEELLVNLDRKPLQNGPEGAYTWHVYVLPALINSSCLPNVSVTMFTGLKSFPKVVRASRRIVRGEELFFPSSNIFCPVDERRDSEGAYCRCRRCVFEGGLLDQFSRLKELQNECTNLWDQRKLLPLFSSSTQATFWTTCVEAINSVNTLFNVELAALAFRERAWIKATFVRLYVLVLLNPVGRSYRDSFLRDFVFRIERNLVLDAIVDMKEVDPASLLALSMCAERIKYPSLLNYGEVDILLPAALQFLTVNFGTSSAQGLDICASGGLKGRLTELDD